MASTSVRFLAVIVGLSLVLGAIGASWELARFGRSPGATAERLQREVQRRFDTQARQVGNLARRVAGDKAIIEALGGRDRQAQLFSRLTLFTSPSGTNALSATLYAPAGPAGAYRIVAWSDGPADNLTQTPDRLTGPPALFVAPGTAGLSLVFVEPIEIGGRRAAVVAAEALFAARRAVGGVAPGFQLETSYGPVAVTQVFGGTGDPPAAPGHFSIPMNSGAPAVEIQYSPAQLDAQRAAFRRRAIAVAIFPLAAGVLLATGPLVGRRRRVRLAREWFGWSAAAASLVAVAAAAFLGLAALAGVSAGWQRLVVSLTALAMVSLFPVSAWWRRWPQRLPYRAPARFIIEQLAAGIVLASAVLIVARVLRDRITPSSLARWQFPVLPLDPSALLDLSSLLVVQIAVFWAAGATVALLASRWKLAWRHAIGWAALALWIAPTIALAAAPALAPQERAAALGAVAVAAVFGLFAITIRHAYRHTTQAMRLILVFVALAVPVVAAYPLGTASADRAIRTLIESEYAPATVAAQRPDALVAVLAKAQDEIDRIPNLLGLLAARPAGPTVQSQTAFHVWNQTSLSRDRITSQIELYGPDPDRTLVSHFALNVPEFKSATETGTPAWLSTSCQWEEFAEVSPFGGAERRLLHAQRGICDAAGNFAGAVVIHIMPDYRALPFVSSANPYYEVLAGPDALPPASRVANLQVVVYGWSLQTLFTSGRVAWPISDAHPQPAHGFARPLLDVGHGATANGTTSTSGTIGRASTRWATRPRPCSRTSAGSPRSRWWSLRSSC